MNGVSEIFFILGCSGRYANWKQKNVIDSAGRYHLFVTSLPKFDNKIVIQAMEKLFSESGGTSPVAIRPHPAAMLDWRSRFLLSYMSKRGVSILGRGTSLENDIKDSSVVIGLGSTVLMEAVLCGRPVVQLVHPDFLEYIDMDESIGIMKVDYRVFSLSNFIHNHILSRTLISRN